MRRIVLILILFSFGKANAKFSNPFEWFYTQNSQPFATTYYIDPSGDDATGTGTFGNPWKTLYKACTTVTTSGDSIHINAGTYNETLQCPLSPGVSIGGADSSNTIITSTLTSDFTPILYLGSSEGTNGNQRISKLKFIGNFTTQMAIVVSGRSNVHIYACRFYTFNDRGVVFRGRNDWGDGAPSTYATGNKFYNNFIYDCARSDASYGRGNLETGGQIGLEIYNDTIIQPVRTSNLSGYCIKNVNQGFLKGMKIHDCYLEVPPYPYAIPFTNNHWSFALEFSDQWGSEIYNNRILGSCDQNHQNVDSVNGYNWSVWYHHNDIGFNTLQPNPVEGIILEYHVRSAIIENNIFRNTAIPLYFTPRPGSVISNLVFRNNYCYNVGQSTSGNYAQGIKINTSQPPLVAYRWKIYNNTMIANTTVPPDYGIDIPPGDSMYLVNNIVRGFGNDLHIYDAANDRFFISRNNNFITSQIVGSFPASAVVNGNFSTAPNLDANGIPNTGSPVIDAGIYTGSSYYGVSRDVGSGEYVSGGNASPSSIVPYSRRLIQPANSLTSVTGYAYDPDGTISSQSWTRTSGPTSVTFSNSTSLVTDINGLSTIGDYVIRLTVTDNNGASSYSEFTISVVASGSNVLPVVTCSSNQNLTKTSILSTVTTSVSGGATDSDGSIVSYQWNKLSGSGTISTPTSSFTNITGLDVGLTKLELTATDNDGGVGRDTLDIVINPPTVTTVTSYAGENQSISSSSTTLAGYGIPPTTGGYNLLLYSEQVANAAAWSGNTVSTSNDQATDVTGANTMELFTYSAADVSYWGQTLTVSPSTTYTLSFDVRRGSATDAYWGVRDQSNFNDLVAPTSYYSLTPASGVARIQLTFTTTSSTTSVTVHPVYKSPQTGTIYLGRMQLALASNQLYHLTTTSSYTAGNTTGTISSYLWTKLTGGSATISTPTNDTTSVTGLSAGTYTFELAVTDNLSAVARDTVQVIVSGSNIAPTANAGTDQTITLPTNIVTLSGSGTDPDGTISSYSWTQISGTSATITSSSSASTTVTDLTTAGVRSFELTVTDNNGATGKDTIVVTVNSSGGDVTPPTVTTVTPPNSTTGVSIITYPTITFNEALDPATVTTSSVTLYAGITQITGTVTYSNNTIRFMQNAPLSNNTVYTLTVKGGGADPRVKDVAGNALASNYVYTFTTTNTVYTNGVILILKGIRVGG